MSDPEVPGPDAVEQAIPVEDAPAFTAPSLDPEVSEADALEQAMEAPVDDGDDLR